MSDKTHPAVDHRRFFELSEDLLCVAGPDGRIASVSQS